jgi:hypothetical protein
MEVESWGLDGPNNSLVLDLIDAAVMAGAYAALAGANVEAERGLLRMAAKYSAEVAAFAGEICSEAASRFMELAMEGEEGAGTQRPLPYCRRDDRR